MNERPNPPTVRRRQEPNLSPWQHARIAQVLEETRASLEADDPDIGDDQKLLLDMIDGQSTGIDGIRSLILTEIHLGLEEAALKAAAAVFRGHATRPAKRAERKAAQRARLRRAIGDLMGIAGATELSEPEFTAYFADLPDSLSGELDGNALSDEYVDVVTTRVPKKDKVIAALKAGIEVEGAPPLANKQRALRIRTS